MVPAHPPLPTAWNLPFQPDAGIRTAILMSESLVGFSVAATGHNAGTSRNTPAAPRPPRAAGGANSPAATGCASVRVVSGNASDARLSQVAAAAAAGADSTVATQPTINITRIPFLRNEASLQIAE